LKIWVGIDCGNEVPWVLSGGGCPVKAGKAEHLQPVWMGLAGQQLGGKFAVASGLFATGKRLTSVS